MSATGATAATAISSSWASEPVIPSGQTGVPDGARRMAKVVDANIRQQSVRDPAGRSACAPHGWLARGDGTRFLGQQMGLVRVAYHPASDADTFGAMAAIACSRDVCASAISGEGVVNGHPPAGRGRRSFLLLVEPFFHETGGMVELSCGFIVRFVADRNVPDVAEAV